MSLNVEWTGQFKKDYKLAMKRNRNIDKLDDVIRMLADGKALPQSMCDHSLTGKFKGFRECHIEPDWLLIYMIRSDVLILTLARTGSHSDLFE